MRAIAEEINQPGPPDQFGAWETSADTARLVDELDRLPVTAAMAPIDELDVDDLRLLVEAVRRTECALAGLLVRVAHRSTCLAETGAGPPARELLLNDGRAVRGRQAGTEAARAELIELEPTIGDRLRAGQVSIGHVDVLASRLLHLDETTRNRLCLTDLLAAAERLPVDTFARHVGRAVTNVETTPAPETDQPPDDAKRTASYVRHWFDGETGMGHVHARLDPERYEALTTALDAHTARLAASGDRPTKRDEKLAAGALVDLVTGSDGVGREGSALRGRRSRRPHVTVIVGPDSAETGNGLPLGDHAVRRLLCDADLQRVLLDGRGLPVNVGRRYRTATSTQWTALRALYSSCAWHLCDRPLSWCQLHHIREWERGGPTDLDNLVPLCSEHHHRVHEGQWGLQLLEDRSLVITRPNGTHHATTDPPSRCGEPCPC